jgi:hypothetical protein
MSVIQAKENLKEICINCKASLGHHNAGTRQCPRMNMSHTTRLGWQSRKFNSKTIIKEKINKQKRVKVAISYVEEVNHPAHYGGADNPYETIKVMEKKLSTEEFIGAMKFQVFKYHDRAGKKSNTDAEKDYAKAAFYANYLSDFIKRQIKQI